jgi:hypothetical protein
MGNVVAIEQKIPVHNSYSSAPMISGSEEFQFDVREGERLGDLLGKKPQLASRNSRSTAGTVCSIYGRLPIRVA